MGKRYKILQKKLRELETELEQIFSTPNTEQSSHSVRHNEIYSQDIEQRLLFLRTLLQAEISTSPPKPHHLEHIGRRLFVLENAFHEWNDNHGNVTTALKKMKGPCEDDDQDNVESSTLCTCSCTESYGGGEGGDSDHEEEASEVDGFLEQDRLLELESVLFEKKDDHVLEEPLNPNQAFCEVKSEVVIKKEEEAEGGGGGGAWRFYRGLVCGMVSGVALMGFVMFSICGCFPYSRHCMCVTPT